MAMNFLGIKFVGGKWIFWGSILVGAFFTFTLLYALLVVAFPGQPYGPVFGFIAIPTFMASFFAFWKVYDIEISSLSEQQREAWVLESRRDYRLLPSPRRRRVKFGILTGIFIYLVAIVLLMLVIIVLLSVGQENISPEAGNQDLVTLAWPVMVTAFFAPHLIWKWARNLESLHYSKENPPQPPPE